MNKNIFYLLLLFPILIWSQKIELKDKIYYYNDSVKSILIWYGTDKIIDSIKTYYPNGSKKEIFYFDAKGKMNSNAFQYNQEGEKLVTWTFSNGKLLSRTDHKLPFNKNREETVKKTLKLLTELNTKTNYNPTNINELNRRASLRCRLGNDYLALMDFKKVEYIIAQITKKQTKTIPDSIVAKREKFKSNLYDNIANIYVYLEMENYAYQYFCKAMSAAPNDYRILYNFASYLQKRKSNDLARYYLEKVLAAQPEHGHANWGIARLYSDIGEYEKAMTSINKAFIKEKGIIERTTNYGGRDLKTTRGLLYHKLGESEKGIADLKKALDMDKNNSYAMKNLGIIYLDQKKYNEACQLFNKAKELNYTLVYDEKDLDALLENACNNVQLEKTNEERKPYIFPNPAKTSITVENYNFKNFDYEFFDFESNSVLKGKCTATTIDVSRLNEGFYILQIINPDSPQTFKIIKE